MKRIGVLTSGGDAPGMNAAIRAVVRTGLHEGWQVFGIRRGYEGLIAGEMTSLSARDVGGVMQQGGTMLGTTRCQEFESGAGQRKAMEACERLGIEGLIVIGGNGSQRGAHAVSKTGFPVVGVASTIDNDIYGAEITIGVDTALNIALEAIDRLKVTASSLKRAFLVEVMGRKSGYLALMAGIAGGAEVVVVPEFEIDPEEVALELRAAYDRGKAHAVVVVAEGCRYNAERLTAYFEENRERLGFQLRVTILGHVQRGGVPTAFDRLLATRLSAAATEALGRGSHGIMVGLQRGEITATPLAEVASRQKPLDQSLLELSRVLAA